MRGTETISKFNFMWVNATDSVSAASREKQTLNQVFTKLCQWANASVALVPNGLSEEKWTFFFFKFEICVDKCWPDFYIHQLEIKTNAFVTILQLFVYWHSSVPPCHSGQIEKAVIYFHNGEQIAVTAQQTLLIHLQRGTVAPNGRSRTNTKRKIK